MKLRSLIAVAMILLSLQTQAEDNTCELRLEGCEKSVQNWKGVVEKQDEYIAVLTKQRNEAMEKLGSEDSRLPWYVWAIVGVAGGVVLTRGLR